MDDLGSTDLPRHSFVTVAPDAWTAALDARHPALSQEPVVRTWADLGRPLIARRRADGDGPRSVPLGLPLPPDMGKQRIAVVLPHSAILAVRPPPLLASVADAVPVAWRETIAALLALAASRSLVPRVFGSFAWQASTGLDYVTATSDLDLIWPLDAQLPSVLHAIAAIENGAPGRLDGEVVGPLGAVHWRELSTGTREVLVKTSSAVMMVSRDLFVMTHP